MSVVRHIAWTRIRPGVDVPTVREVPEGYRPKHYMHEGVNVILIRDYIPDTGHAGVRFRRHPEATPPSALPLMSTHLYGN